jgi:hypothetical protein
MGSKQNHEIEVREMASDIVFSSNKSALLSVLGFSEHDNFDETNKGVDEVYKDIMELAKSCEDLVLNPNAHVRGIMLVDRNKKKAVRNAAAYVRYVLKYPG